MELNVTSANFAAYVEQSELPVLLDFWAPWCGPCRMVGPIVEELAQDLEGQVRVGKVNVDEEGELASAYGVMSIPTLILFRGGKEVDRLAGAQSKAALLRFVGQA